MNTRTKFEKAFGIIIPCYNEESTVKASVRGLLNINYTNYTAVYINDGSVDRTLDVLNEELDLNMIPGFNLSACSAKIKAVYQSQIYPYFFVVDKHNGGKSECLNIGIKLLDTDFVVTLDADCILEQNALKHMNQVFDDENVVAAGGSIQIMQGFDYSYMKSKISLNKRILILLQILDYIKGFYIYKMSLYKQKAIAIISGAFGVFRKKILLELNGYRKTLGEDVDITLRIQKLIHKTKRRIVYCPNALCFTQCPEKWSDLIKQRLRWQKGFINSSIYNSMFILKTFFYRSVTFHFFIEAILVGVTSCIYTLLTLLFVFTVFFGESQNLFIFGIYFVFRIVFSIFYSAGAIKISKKYNQYPYETMKQLYFILLIDVTLFWLFNILIYLTGIILYFWSPDKINDWNKVERSKEFFNDQ